MLRAANPCPALRLPEAGGLDSLGIDLGVGVWADLGAAFEADHQTGRREDVASCHPRSARPAPPSLAPHRARQSAADSRTLTCLAALLQKREVGHARAGVMGEQAVVVPPSCRLLIGRIRKES